MATRAELFEGLLNILEPGGITSDISYYAEGRATATDYENLIKVAFERTETGSPERAEFIGLLNTAGFFKPSDNLDFWINKADASNVQDVADLQNAAVERMPTLLTEAAAAQGVKDIPDDIIDPLGATEEFSGIMAGGTIHRVINVEGQPDYYVVAYEYPPGSGHSFYYRYDSAKALEQAVGPNLGGGAVPIGEPLDELIISQWTDGGPANEIEGVPGTFNGYLDDISREAGILAGIDDPTLVGEALKNRDIALIMAKAAEGEWTRLQVKAALRGTDYYKDVLHPGIENFYAQSDDPEALYAMYKQNVEASLKSLGIPQDPQGGYGSQLASLLDKGVSDTAFATFAQVYKQAQTNVGFAGALSKWTERFTGVAISSFEDYFDVLAGNSPAEILEIAEIAGLQFMADNAGFDITDQDLRNISEATDLSQEGAAQLFSRTARDLLALGERGLRRGGLTSQQVLEAEAGIGGNVEKTRLLMSKLAREEGLIDDPTATIFTDFNREGSPIKLGLQSTISEGA